MIEQQRQRIEQEMTRMVDDLDRHYLRKMQGDMHLCAAKCCDDNTSSMDYVQRCVERCSAPTQKAQRYTQNELERFQSKLQRCILDCNDSVKDKMPPNPSEEQIAKLTNSFERCAVKCVDSHVELLPALFKSVKSVLSKGANAIPDN